MLHLCLALFPNKSLFQCTWLPVTSRSPSHLTTSPPVNTYVITKEPRCHPSWQKMDSPSVCARCVMFSSWVPSLSRGYDIHNAVSVPHSASSFVHSTMTTGCDATRRAVRWCLPRLLSQPVLAYRLETLLLTLLPPQCSTFPVLYTQDRLARVEPAQRLLTVSRLTASLFF